MKTMKIKMKNTKNRNSKISYLQVQWLKLTFSELKRKIKFINKQRRHTIFFSKKLLISKFKRFYIL